MTSTSEHHANGSELTLTGFLLARIEEREEMAAISTGRVYACSDGCLATPQEEWADGSDRLPNHHNTWSLIHDPARVLAECEAQRRIVEWASDGEGEWHWSTVLAPLAAVDADHPDYRQEWKP